MSDCTGCPSAAIRKWYNPAGPCCREVDRREVLYTPTGACRMCLSPVPAEHTLPYCTTTCFEKDRRRVLSVHDHLLVRGIGRGR